VYSLELNFEYACEVWDNCGMGNAIWLEQVQLENAIIIVTNIPHIFYINTMSNEICWESQANVKHINVLQYPT
jgi:hypothetical protein